jgi:hypothetical protein
MLQTLVFLPVNVRVPLHQETFLPVLLDMVTVNENPKAEQQGSDGYEREDHSAPETDWGPAKFRVSAFFEQSFVSFARFLGFRTGYWRDWRDCNG